MNRLWSIGAVGALYLLHFDFWFWHRPEVVLGLPVGLLYHLVYCFLVALILALLTRRLGRPAPLRRDPDVTGS